MSKVNVLVQRETLNHKNINTAEEFNTTLKLLRYYDF